MSIFTYEPDELLIEAKMSGTAIIIVEGIDDIPIYEDLINSLNNKNIEVYASENLSISNHTRGCQGVVKALENINEFAYNMDIEKYILGIIDKDVKEFRGETLCIKGLFILDYYSIESHFVVSDNISYVINQVTNASKSLSETINKQINLFNNIVTDMMDDLFYISLDALKNSCDKDYVSTYKYSDNIFGIINVPNYQCRLEEQIPSLNSFANEKNIKNNFDNLLLIVKGKWLLDYYVVKIMKLINTLHDHCNAHKLCQNCQNEKYNNCSFKVLFNINTSNIKTLILKNTSIDSLDYIKERINKMF